MLCGIFSETESLSHLQQALWVTTPAWVIRSLRHEGIRAGEDKYYHNHTLKWHTQELLITHFSYNLQVYRKRLRVPKIPKGFAFWHVWYCILVQRQVKWYENNNLYFVFVGDSRRHVSKCSIFHHGTSVSLQNSSSRQHCGRYERSLYDLRLLMPIPVQTNIYYVEQSYLPMLCHRTRSIGFKIHQIMSVINYQARII